MRIRFDTDWKSIKYLLAQSKILCCAKSHDNVETTWFTWLTCETPWFTAKFIIPICRIVKFDTWFLVAIRFDRIPIDEAISNGYVGGNPIEISIRACIGPAYPQRIITRIWFHWIKMERKMDEGWKYNFFNIQFSHVVLCTCRLFQGIKHIVFRLRHNSCQFLTKPLAITTCIEPVELEIYENMISVLTLVSQKKIIFYRLRDDRVLFVFTWMG